MIAIKWCEIHLSQSGRLSRICVCVNGGFLLVKHLLNKLYQAPFSKQKKIKWHQNLFNETKQTAYQHHHNHHHHQSCLTDWRSSVCCWHCVCMPRAYLNITYKPHTHVFDSILNYACIEFDGFVVTVTATAVAAATIKTVNHHIQSVWKRKKGQQRGGRYRISDVQIWNAIAVN